LDYLFFSGYSFPPDFVTIVPTKRCNFNCSRCAARSYLSQQENRVELSTEEFKKIFDKLAKFKPSIYFSGGEPFLRADIFELLEYLKRKRMIVGIVSNGSLFDENAVRRLIDIRVDFFGVSLDGSQDYHDAIRGYKGSFLKIKEGIGMILDLKKKLNVKLPQVKITCIIDHENIQEAESVLKFANELGVDQVDFGYCMFYTGEIEKEQDEFVKARGVGGRAVIGRRISGDFNINCESWVEFFKNARKNSKIPVSVYDIGMNFADFYSFKKPANHSKCLTPWFCAVINPDGTLEPCQNFKVGNLLKEDFFDIWNNKQMRTFRRIRKKEVFPACFRCIEGQRIRFD